MEQQTPSSSLFQLTVDANVGMSLRSAASWAKVLGILGIIFGILFVVVGIMIQTTVGSVTDGYEDYGYRGSTGTLANVGMAMYIGMGVITILGSIFAVNFGSKASAALRSNDSNTLRSSFSNLRNYFAFWGILMMIGLLLMIIGIVGGSVQNM